MQVIDLHLYLKCHSSKVVFQTFASKNQLPGFYISGTLTENGLKHSSSKDSAHVVYTFIEIVRYSERRKKDFDIDFKIKLFLFNDKN